MRSKMHMERRLILIASVLLLMFASGCRSTPRFQGMTAEQLWEHSERAMEEENWSDAVASLQRLLVTYPAFDRAVEARMNLARAFYERGEELSAAAEYLRVVERNPGHARAPEAGLGVCRAYSDLSPIPQRDQTYTRQAITHCQRVPRDYPGSPEAVEAERIRVEMVNKLAHKTLLNGQYYFRNRLYDSALIYFDRVLEVYPDSPSAPRALLLTMRSYAAIGWTEEAEEARERLLSTYPDSEAARELTDGP
jgi:outer membrane protein assembly factor BamD